MGKRVKTDSKHGKQASRKKVPSEQTGGSAWGKKVSEWFAGQDVYKRQVVEGATFGLYAKEDILAGEKVIVKAGTLLSCLLYTSRCV